MLLIKNYDRVGDDADYDRGHAVEHVGGEANRVTQTVAAVLGKIDACAHAYRHAQKAGQGENEYRSHDGISHSSAGFAYRFWGLREEGPVDGTDAAINQISEDGEQRHQHQNYREHGDSGHYVIGDATPQCDGRDGVLDPGFRHWPSMAGRGSRSRLKSARAR